jgi:hypothetical protein
LSNFSKTLLNFNPVIKWVDKERLYLLVLLIEWRHALEELA